MNIKYFDHAATTAVALQRYCDEMIPYFSKIMVMHPSMYEIARISKEL